MIRAWNDDEHYEDLMQSLLEAPRVPLLEARPEHGPAFYVLFLASAARRLTALYDDLALGADPIYAGAADDGAERMGRHRTNLAGARGLPLRGLFVSVLPMTSEAEAYYRERLFQQRNRICYCQPRLAGLGSRRQGTVREQGQRPSRFDCITSQAVGATGHPGREGRGA